MIQKARRDSVLIYNYKVSQELWRSTSQTTAVQASETAIGPFLGDSKNLSHNQAHKELRLMFYEQGFLVLLGNCSFTGEFLCRNIHQRHLPSLSVRLLKEPK